MAMRSPIAQTLIIFSTEQDGLGNSHGYDLQHRSNRKRVEARIQLRARM
jgi:hypothetical protein